MERAKILQHVADVEAGEAETVEAEVIEDEQ
jgi:hypothetical protein